MDSGANSPLLGNSYLHYVFDFWAHQRRSKTAKGDFTVVRYADDSVALQSEALHFLDRLCERMATHAGDNAARNRSTSSGSRTSAL
ncbi:hypothetical protein AS156_04605 [Bradyrhizobium macuxiense]|uniref:Reverse transcriptase domain-containing protein n=1 Tax=Bradyrhizobium macuxiense TaxID=1755647 RepID=A0A109JWC8_9BRAD|nr:hypothetical protein AS156_04605 [Bradyrhizobium macuxiense]